MNCENDKIQLSIRDKIHNIYIEMVNSGSKATFEELEDFYYSQKIYKERR